MQQVTRKRSIADRQSTPVFPGDKTGESVEGEDTEFQHTVHN